MFQRISLLALLLLANLSFGQNIKLSQPHDSSVAISSNIKGQTGKLIFVQAIIEAKMPITWQSLDPGLEMVPLDYLISDQVGIFFSPKPGTYRIIVYQKETREPPTFALIEISDSAPGPQPPAPGPQPPAPGPQPPVPDTKPVAKLRVAIFYESDPNVFAKLPRSQQLIFTAKDVLTYLDSHCIKVGRTPEYRIYDLSNTNLNNETKAWQDVAKLPRPKIPWLIILDNDTPVYQGELPVSPAGFLTLMGKYESK